MSSIPPPSTGLWRRKKTNNGAGVLKEADSGNAVFSCVVYSGRLLHKARKKNIINLLPQAWDSVFYEK